MTLNATYEQAQPKIGHGLHTICRDCVFKVPDNEGQQIGCAVNKLTALSNNGADIVAESNYFKIVNRYCTSCRNDEWAEHHEGNLIDRMYEELTAKLMDVIIVITNNRLDRFLETMESVLNQTTPPKKIIVSASSNVFRKTINRIISELKNKKVKLWQVTQASSHMDPSGITQRLLDDWDYINYGNGKSDALYFTTIKSGFCIPVNFIETIDELINKNMERFVLVKPMSDDYNGMIVQNKIFRMVGGNSEKTIVEKIELLAKDQNVSYMIRTPEGN